MNKKPILAILYDFDSTLAVMDMQNFAFIPALGLTPKEFWEITSEFSKKTGCEKTLAYLYVMMDECRKRGIKMTPEYLKEMGKGIKFFKGVEDWFERINAYGEENGIEVEHYLVSSGNKEIVEGCSIRKYFKMVYGCEFIFDEETRVPVWPKLSIDYTQKTQYYYRVAKGVLDTSDDNSVNIKTPVKRVPPQNIVYIGDGLTDIPSMITAKEKGGNAIAVYKDGEQEKVMPLFRDGRVNYVCPTDYSDGAELDQIMKLIIKSVKIHEKLKEKGNC